MYPNLQRKSTNKYENTVALILSHMYVRIRESTPLFFPPFHLCYPTAILNLNSYPPHLSNNLCVLPSQKKSSVYFLMYVIVMPTSLLCLFTLLAFSPFSSCCCFC